MREEVREVKSAKEVQERQGLPSLSRTRPLESRFGRPVVGSIAAPAGRNGEGLGLDFMGAMAGGGAEDVSRVSSAMFCLFAENSLGEGRGVEMGGLFVSELKMDANNGAAMSGRSSLRLGTCVDINLFLSQIGTMPP